MVGWTLDAHAAGYGAAGLGAALGGTVLAAGATAVAGVGVALVLAWSTRPAGGGGPVARAAVSAATSGYAIPGAVVAVGVLAVVTRADPWGVLSGSFAALLYAYIVRYLAVVHRPVAAGFETIGPSMEWAARSLGRGSLGALHRVHAPLARGSIAAGIILVFVEVAKELPLTLVLRPFDFETLAVQAYARASDERLAQAGLPSLVLVALSVFGIAVARRLLNGPLSARAGGAQ